MCRTIQSLLLSALIPYTASAQPCDPVLLSLSGAENLDIATDGDFAYVATGSEGLAIYDVSNPASPLLVARYESSAESTRGVVVHDDVAYIATNENLEIIDVSNPASPTLLRLFAGIAASDIDIDWPLLAVTRGDDGLSIINVTNPAAPVLTDTVTYFPDPKFDTGFSHVILDNPVAYTIDNKYGLLVYDVSNQADIQLLDSSATFNVRDIQLDGDTLFVIRSTTLRAMDVSDPANVAPISTASYNNALIAGDSTLIDDYLYIQPGNPFDDGVVFDVSNPSNMVLFTQDSGVRGEYADSSNGALVTTNLGLQAFDVTTPTTPALQGAAYRHSDRHNRDLRVADDTAFLIGLRSLIAVDFTNPAAPVAVGGLDILNAGSAERLVLSDDASTAYIAADLDCFAIADISTPSSLSLITTHHTSSRVIDLDVEDDILYAASFDFGLQIYDVSNPAAPTHLADIDSLGTMRFVTVEGSTAYIARSNTADDFARLEILDVSNPAAPAHIATFDAPGQAFSKPILRDDLLYLISYDYGVSVVNVADPSAPTLVGSLELDNLNANTRPGLVGDILLAGIYTNSWIQPIYVGNPASPTPFGDILTYNNRGTLAAIVPHNNIVLTPAEGLYIEDFNACAPNPADFNGNGTVDSADLAALLAAWGGPAADLDDNGITDAADLAILLAAWS